MVGFDDDKDDDKEEDGAVLIVLVSLSLICPSSSESILYNNRFMTNTGLLNIQIDEHTQRGGDNIVWVWGGDWRLE